MSNARRDEDQHATACRTARIAITSCPSLRRLGIFARASFNLPCRPAELQRHVFGLEVLREDVAQLLRTGRGVVAHAGLAGLGRAHAGPEVGGPLDDALVGGVAVRARWRASSRRSSPLRPRASPPTGRRCG